MANFAQPGERFVYVPGIIEIKRCSDDPDFYQRPTDLFDEQAKGGGLSQFDGKKNKLTLEQAFFTCKICECECKSVATLRAHCKGQQHIRKALTKKKEYFDARKAISSKSKGNSEEKYSSHGNCKKEERNDPGTYETDGKENKNWIKRESGVFKSNSENVKEGKRDWVEAKMDERGGKYGKKTGDGSVRRNMSIKMHGENRLSSKHADLQSSQDYVAKRSPTKMPEVEKLHQKVAECVKKRLNTYLVAMEKTEPKIRKLRKSEYAELAKKFSHKMRSMIKDSYQTIHGSLNGIEFTLDQQEQMNTEIDMYFDPLPVIKFDN